MRVIALIPARSGSKSVPNKNIAPLGGHPLIAYSIVEALLSELIKDVYVSTDSEEYATIAKGYGAQVPFLRPKELSLDDSTDKEFFQYFFDYLIADGQLLPDLVVHLRPTTPLRHINIIDKAIRIMMEQPIATSLRSMHKTLITPYKLFKKEERYAKPFLDHPEKEFYNLPRQTFEDTFLPNGYVDIIKPHVYKETGLLHGDKIYLYETAAVADIDINDDYIYAEKLLKKKEFSYLKDYLEVKHE